MASGRSIRCVDIEILGSAWEVILWGAPQTHFIFIKWVFIRADSANWATIHEHHVCFVPVSDVARLFEVGALLDIGWATANMCLGITDATLTAAANEIACRCVGQCDGRQHR